MRVCEFVVFHTYFWLEMFCFVHISGLSYIFRTKEQGGQNQTACETIF